MERERKVTKRNVLGPGEAVVPELGHDRESQNGDDRVGILSPKLQEYCRLENGEGNDSGSYENVKSGRGCPTPVDSAQGVTGQDPDIPNVEHREEGIAEAYRPGRTRLSQVTRGCSMMMSLHSCQLSRFCWDSPGFLSLSRIPPGFLSCYRISRNSQPSYIT